MLQTPEKPVDALSAEDVRELCYQIAAEAHLARIALNDEAGLHTSDTLLALNLMLIRWNEDAYRCRFRSHLRPSRQTREKRKGGGVMTQNVTPIRPEDEEREEEIARWRAFDKLITDWMIAHAESRSVETDEEIDAACERKNELLWKIIRTRGRLPRNTDDKFAIMLLDMGDDKLWRGYSAMIESIRSDIEDGWDSPEPA